MKPPLFSPSYSPSSSSSNSMKLKTLLQTFVSSHVHRIARSLAKAKSIIIQLLKETHFLHSLEFRLKKNKQKKNLFFESFKLHYNWCSSDSSSYVYCDSSWNSVVQKTTPLDYYEECNNELFKYLQCLEEKGDEECCCCCCNEIDRLADLFIENCHEKFRLEKQESYRRFQEMMDRSV